MISSLVVLAMLAPQGPLMQDLMGLCVHTVLFKPEQYRGVVGWVRDYHPTDWDLADDTSALPPWPKSKNGVDWAALYPAWQKQGFRTTASLMFDEKKSAFDWKNLEKDTFAYGKAIAEQFGPSSRLKALEAVEIGNEPGQLDDATYKQVLANMAGGVRAGDPKMTILPCAMKVGASTRYERNVEVVRGLESKIDGLNMHLYAQAEGWPTWRRSFPEDPSIAYLKELRAMRDWRDKHLPGKPIWVTEFGWDASSKPAPKEGEGSKWIGNNELEQARYIVRSFLLFAREGMHRASVYWFDDQDLPQMHGSSGLTRNGVPKPAFYAVRGLFRELGPYRFDRVVTEKPGEAYVYAFKDQSGKEVWAAWSPTGSSLQQTIELKTRAKGATATEMAISERASEPVPLKKSPAGFWIKVGESPSYVRFQ